MKKDIYDNLINTFADLFACAGISREKFKDTMRQYSVHTNGVMQEENDCKRADFIRRKGNK